MNAIRFLSSCLLHILLPTSVMSVTLLTVSSPVNANPLIVELESLSTQPSFPPFEVLNDTNASGGQYIEWPVNSGSGGCNCSPEDSDTGLVQINFSLSDTTDVQFDINVLLPSTTNDSFWYKLDSNNWQIINGYRSSYWRLITPDVFSNLAAGQHTLKILRREKGSRLDHVSLTATSGNITALQDEVELTIDKSVNNENPTVGDTVVFTLTVSNSGPDDAVDVRVDDVVPSGFGNLQVVSLPSSSNMSIAANTVLWTNIFVPASGDASATFSAEILPP